MADPKTRYFNWSLVVALAIGALIVGVHEERGFAAGGSEKTTRRASESDGLMVREGVRLQDKLGQFKLRGDRAIFVSLDGEQQFGGLENLNLERIVRTISDSPTDDVWSVTGVVTEYRGTNYLLVTHAVKKNRRTAIDRPSESEDSEGR